MQHSDFFTRKMKRKQKIFWFPFESAKILKEASESTGLTQTELVTRGINLVVLQEKVSF